MRLEAIWLIELPKIVDWGFIIEIMNPRVHYLKIVPLGVIWLLGKPKILLFGVYYSNIAISNKHTGFLC